MIKETVTVTIDRAMGSAHPKYPELIYPVNYGYIKGIYAGDGEEQDVYVLGVDEPVQEFTGLIVAVIHRLNDNEDKWVAAPAGKSYTEQEVRDATAFQEQYFDIEIIM